MKKFYKTLCVLVITALVTVTICYNQEEENTLLKSNVEALALGEGVVQANCGNYYSLICVAWCNSCNAKWEKAGSPGPASNVTGECTCGGNTFRTVK